MVEKAPTKSVTSAKNCKIRQQCKRVVREVVEKAPTKSANSAKIANFAKIAKNCKIRQQCKSSERGESMTKNR